MQIDSEALANMPLRDADQAIRDQIEEHRSQMAHLRAARAARVAAERASGKSIAELMDELGVTREVVQRLLRTAKAPD